MLSKVKAFEAKLNPVVVLAAGRGVVAVDALVRLAGNPNRPSMR